MTSLLKRIEKRLADPKLNANFNREVSRRLAQVESDPSSTIPWNEVKRT